MSDGCQEIVSPMNLSRMYLASLLIVITVWGFAYEASFFISAGLSLDQLSIPHYFASGGRSIAFMLGILLIWTQLGKFFSRQIYQDDSKALQEQLKSVTFEKAVVEARVALAIGIAYWIIVISAEKYNLAKDTWTPHLFVAFFIFQMFFACLAVSPQHSRLSVYIAFIFAVSLCFSAGGYGSGKSILKRNNVVRDDMIVKITRTDGKISVEAKQVTWPSQILEKFASALNAK
jgi:hypothetical protein